MRGLDDAIKALHLHHSRLSLLGEHDTLDSTRLTLGQLSKPSRKRARPPESGKEAQLLGWGRQGYLDWQPP